MRSEKNSPQAWLVCLTSALFFFYMFIQMNMFNSINEKIAAHFSLGPVELGSLSAMYLYGMVVFLIAAGVILDHFSIKKVLCTAVAVTCVSTFCFAISTQPWHAFAARFVIGLGASFAFLSSLRLAVNWFTQERLALVIGLVVTMAMLGGMVAQTPIVWMLDSMTWQQVMKADVALGMVFLVIIFLIVKDCPESETAEEGNAPQVPFVTGLMSVLSNKQNWLAGLYTGLINLPVMILGAVWGTSYLVYSQSISALEASSVISMIFLGLIFGSPAFGYISDKLYNRKQVMIWGAIFSIVIMLVIMFIPTKSNLVMSVLFFLLGFVTSSQVIGYPVIAESNEIAINGTAMGLGATIIMGSGAIAQPLFGWLLTHFAPMGVNAVTYAPGYEKAIWVLPISFLVALLLMFFLRETAQKP